MILPEFKYLLHTASHYLPVHLHDQDLSKYDVLPGDYDYSRKLFGVKGKIWREEAMTLHSLARFSPGPVLELGCFHGASTVILSRANSDVTTVDLSEHAIGVAKQTFLNHKVNPRVIQADAAAGIKQLAAEKKKFSFVFVDHDHAYNSVNDACWELPKVLDEQAFIYFHDLQDIRNGTGEYGVYRAVREMQSRYHSTMDFFGLSGNGAIFHWFGVNLR